MKDIFSNIMQPFLLFPQYLIKNGYFKTIKFVYKTEGRIGRKIYFSFVFMPLIISIAILSIMMGIYIGMASFPISEMIMGIGFYSISILYLPFLFSIFFLNIRRFHDFGYSGWWQLCNFILPIFFFFLVILVCMFDKGEPEKNKYGPVPEKQ